MMPTFRAVRFSLVCLATSALAILVARSSYSQESDPSPLDGAWKLVEQRNGDAQEYQKLAEGMEQIKYVTGGRFIWTMNQGGRITSGAGGKYKVDKDKYTETIESFAGDGQESLMGKTFEFTWKLEGKTWLHVGKITVNGQELKIDEKWERCSK